MLRFQFYLKMLLFPRLFLKIKTFAVITKKKTKNLKSNEKQNEKPNSPYKKRVVIER